MTRALELGIVILAVFDVLVFLLLRRGYRKGRHPLSLSKHLVLSVSIDDADVMPVSMIAQAADRRSWSGQEVASRD